MARHGGQAPAPGGQGGREPGRQGNPWGLYLLLVAMVSLGMLLAWVGGDVVFNLVSIPVLTPDPGRVLEHRVQDLHATVGWIILGLAGIHASAALVHRYVWHDGVLGRMLPWQLGQPDAVSPPARSSPPGPAGAD